MATNELNEILQKFASCGWDLIDVPSKAWLANANGEADEKLKKRAY